jgi:hypothetical protein
MQHKPSQHTRNEVVAIFATNTPWPWANPPAAWQQSWRGYPLTEQQEPMSGFCLPALGAMRLHPTRKGDTKPSAAIRRTGFACLHPPLSRGEVDVEEVMGAGRITSLVTPREEIKVGFYFKIKIIRSHRSRGYKGLGYGLFCVGILACSSF